MTKAALQLTSQGTTHNARHVQQALRCLCSFGFLFCNACAPLVSCSAMSVFLWFLVLRCLCSFGFLFCNACAPLVSCSVSPPAASHQLHQAGSLWCPLLCCERRGVLGTESGVFGHRCSERLALTELGKAGAPRRTALSPHPSSFKAGRAVRGAETEP